MGKLTIRGKASMNCTYDMVTLEIEFYKDGNTANTAMDAVLTQCESFLSQKYGGQLLLKSVQMLFVYLPDNSCNGMNRYIGHYNNYIYSL